MSFLARLNRPWVHFVAIGVLLFWLQGKLFPEPKPVVGPLAKERIEALQQQWFSSVGRPPSEEQLQRMIDAELDRDMMFQRAVEMDMHLYDPVVYQRLLRNMHFLRLGEGKSEEELYEQALEMRLHLGDEVVKRRLIQVMEQVMLASNPPAQPTEEQVAAEFAARKEELRRPPRYSIEHIYFNRDRRGEAALADAERLRARLAAGEEGLDLAELGDRLPLPGKYSNVPADKVARRFGSTFAERLADLPVDRWAGPIESGYGWHLVQVDSRTSERVPHFDAITAEVREAWIEDQRDAHKAKAYQVLRGRYTVVLPAIPDPPTLTAVLR